MRSLIASVAYSLAMLSIAASTSLAQVSRPSVYVEPGGPLGSFLARSMAKKQVPIDLVTDRASAAYVLSASHITTGIEETGGLFAPNEINVAKISVALSGAASNEVVWSDFLSEPAEGRKTEQVLADLAAKRLKKFMKKNHGLAASARAEQSHSIAAVVGSLFRR
jgi:hypothetical protein